MQHGLNPIFAVFALVLIRKILILEESGYSAAVIGEFMRTAWIMIKLVRKQWQAASSLLSVVCSACKWLFIYKMMLAHETI